MIVRQLSLFLENKPGRLAEPCALLAREGIDIRTLSLADTQQYGILRLIVSDWEKAAALLKEAGYVVKATEVLAVEVPDHPGGLAHLLDALARSPVNIEYMYAFPFDRSVRAVMIFRFDNPEAAIEALKAAGIGVVESVEVYNR